MSLKVNEIFHSLQGEGADVGLPTTFVRLTVCNLRCVWCDSEYSFYEGKDIDRGELRAIVGRYKTKRVCLTGGEPLLQAEVVDFVEDLLGDGYRVVVETSGSIDISRLDAVSLRERLCVSMDVKCPGSTMEHKNRWENLALLRPQDQLKFVILDDADYDYAVSVLRKHPVRAPVVLQPVWGADGVLRRIAERVLHEGLDARVSTQLHKHIWGEGPGH
ncbi:MAG: radical SAM protein [Methanobacteriota archaeon]